MAIYKNISAKYIIAKIYRDLGLDDPNYEYSFLEWFGEALDFIGSGAQLIQYNTEVTVSDFKGLLPNNFVVLHQLKYKDPDQDCWKLIEYNPKNFKGTTDDCDNLKVATEESFSLNPNYIETTFETGTVLISYKGIATDDDGYPLVPDNQYFKEALFWYAYKQMLLSGFQSRVQTIDYHFADQKWQFYCSAARNKANYPDLSQYQRFREIWVGLLPSDIDQREWDSQKPKHIPLDTVNAANLVTTPIEVDNA